jgi:hypothetical protein
MAQLDNTEREILTSINKAVQTNKNRPVTITINGQYFSEVSGARKYSGSLYGANEPYTDFIIQRRNTKGINIALKSVVFNESIQRLEIIVPGLKYKFIRAAYNRIMQMNIEDGQDVPNIFGKIDKRHTEMLIKGTYSVGGPINYMYTDIPKNIKFNYDEDSSVLSLPGILSDINQYAKNIELYLNLIPLYPDQKFDSEAERGGMKLIYGKSESRGEDGNKIVVVQQPADNAIVVDIE